MAKDKVLVINGALIGSKIHINVDGNDFINIEIPNPKDLWITAKPVSINLPANVNEATVTVIRKGLYPFKLQTQMRNKRRADSHEFRIDVIKSRDDKRLRLY